MKTSILAAAAAILLATAGQAFAHDFTHGDLTIEHPHARVIIPSRPAAAFFTVRNKGEADRLLEASSPAFARVELHGHVMKDGVVRMFKKDGVEVPAGGAAPLQSGGDHVMLFDPARPLKVGDSFPLTLTFEKGGAVEVMVKVEPLQATGGHGADKMDPGKMDHGKMDHGGHKH